jgi:DNA polymerase-3 subunit beta
MVVDSVSLIKAINQVVPACSTSEKQPALSGVRLISTSDILTLVATDNSRIAIRSLPVKDGVAISYILPRAALLEVLRVKSGEVTIIFGEKDVTFKAPHLLVSTRPVAGKFPNHEKIVPESTNSSATVMRESFINAVRRVSMMSEEHSPIKLSFGQDMMQMRLASEDGQTYEIFPATIGGEPIDIAFNAQFLLDGLYGVEAKAVFIAANGPMRPALISSDSDDLKYVLMPVRVAA